MTQQQFKDICFTSFNTNIEWFRDWTKENKSIVSYIILQGEYCKDHKQHIQGFCQFTGQKRLEQIKKFFGDNTLHIERRFGTVQQARDYCANTAEYPKEIWRDHMEFGEIRMKEQGKRTDLLKIRDELTEGKTLTECLDDAEDDKTFGTILKYYNSLDRYSRDIKQRSIIRRKSSKYDEYVWKPWQQEIIQYASSNTVRSIKWICDIIGKSGKSELSQYLSLKKNAYIITGGKVQDIYYGYNYQPIVIFDLARTYSDNMDHIYNCIETFKNGYFLSTKYETRSVHFDIPQVIVMANFMPDTSKLSKDRWDIVNIENDEFKTHDINIIPVVETKENNLLNVVENTESINKTIDYKIKYKAVDDYEQDLKVRKMEQLIDRKELKKIQEPECIRYFDRYIYNQSNGKYWDTELFEYVKL